MGDDFSGIRHIKGLDRRRRGEFNNSALCLLAGQVVPHLKPGQSQLQRGHWSSHICPSLQSVRLSLLVNTNWPFVQLAPFDWCLRPRRYNLEKSHLFSSPSESPWRIFPSPLISLGWFALWQISATLHFLEPVFPAPAWKTHKQRTGYFSVLPSLGQRADPSCGVTP